ncbi:MAG TPA: glycosyl hydrolase family 28-related protein [Candidatus Sulfopaludibacter sp.]|nr:glycosyl hydrolase family 28-related protein [Candidatus Sulfopaludibacter sp.]
MFQSVILLSLLICSSTARAGIGAEMPWTTYEAEDMKTTGTVLGPKYDPFLVETESSGEKCVKLADAGQYIEFIVQSPANAMVVRYSLPDSPEGSGLDSTLSLYQNGKFIRKLPVTSRYSWLYGKYPFTNDPKAGKPRNFYNEVRLKGLAFARGDVIRLQKADDPVVYCIVDLVDLEKVAPPLVAPAHSLSVASFGAGGTGQTDDTRALRRCIAEARKEGKIVWVPAGDYKLTGDIVVPADVTIQGAGMWYTTFVGDDKLYDQAKRRVRFKLTGDNIHLADFAIIGKLNYRNDNEPNDGIVGAHCENSTISRLWVEHTKVGMWFYVCSNVVVDGCRLRDTLADGINFCVDTRNCVVQNCTTRNTGDDCFAMWPAASDQSFVQQAPAPGSNVFRHCTGQLPFLANGGAIYGGANNRIEDCLFTDISPGCGILLSTTFPTADASRKIDNNFSGTTVVRDCEVIRSGGFDHDWAWRAAVQLCMDRRSISGVDISNVDIKDSFSDGLSIVAPGSKHGQGTLSNARLENVSIPNCGIGTDSRHALWIRDDACGSVTIVNSQIADVQNSSTNFVIKEYTTANTIHPRAPFHPPTSPPVAPGQEAQASLGQTLGR